MMVSQGLESKLTKKKLTLNLGWCHSDEKPNEQKIN